MRTLIALPELISSPPAALLQHAPHLVPLLEPAPPLPRQHLPIPLPAAGLPLANSGSSPLHAATAHLADALLLLSPGDLRPPCLFAVSCPHMGTRAQSAIGLPGLDRPRPFLSWQQQVCVSLLTVIALFHHHDPDSQIYFAVSVHPKSPLLSFSPLLCSTSLTTLFLDSIVYLICMSL